MTATPQATPQFTGGGTVFGRNSAQWNQYFASKVDAEDGTADNLTLTGSPTINGLVLTPVSGVTVPLSLSNGTLSLTYNRSFGINGSASLDFAPYTSTDENSSFPVVVGIGTYFIDTATNMVTATLPSNPVRDDVYRFKDSTGHAAAHNITVNGNGNNIDGATTSVINANFGKLSVQYNGTQWSVV